MSSRLVRQIFWMLLFCACVATLNAAQSEKQDSPASEVVTVQVASEQKLLADSTLSEVPFESTLPEQLWVSDPRVRKVLQATTTFDAAEPFERMQGGGGTQVTHVDRNAYSQETSTLSFAGLQRFKLGNALFNKLWVASPSSTLASDGLGPFYSARACQSCHIKDGRGQLPVAGEKTSSLVMQLKNSAHLGGSPDPVYGAQFHTSAVPGVVAEGLVDIETTPIVGKFADGTEYRLYKPDYQLVDLGYGELDKQTSLSPRLAPSMHGLGLLEAIDANDILAYADPDDSNGDGISGRANWQRDLDGAPALGKFGHKAAMSTVREQTVHALSTDMGISSARLPEPQGDCTQRQVICQSLAHGDQQDLGEGEAPDQVVDLIAFYSGNLAVPARRDVSAPTVLEGKALFYNSGCISCHVAKHVTSREAVQEEHRFQLVWPYTDLLLHDMGEGLADHAPEGDATGREWRTAPLWGIGLAKAVNPNTSYLHDGRANTLLEAVLWHGGEALESQSKVVAMTQAQRRALVLFLESL